MNNLRLIKLLSVFRESDKGLVTIIESMYFCKGSNCRTYIPRSGETEILIRLLSYYLYI